MISIILSAIASSLIFLILIAAGVTCYVYRRRKHQDKQCPPLLHNTISQSTPDLTREQLQKTRTNYLKVIKQSTLPTILDRHETFRRQTSNIDMSNVEFTIHSIKCKEQPKDQIRPELYKTINHQVPEKDPILHFQISYDNENSTLSVIVKKVENLPPKDFSGTADPYVRVYLHPDKRRRFQTKVQRKSLSPTFNETFTFPLTVDKLGKKSLHLDVCDFDKFSRHDLIGSVMVEEIPTETKEYATKLACSKQVR